MSGRLGFLAGIAVVLMAGAASAQTVYYTDRPLTLPKGTQEASVNLYVDLQKGFEGEAFGVGSGLLGDRAPGLLFHGGLAKNFEMGLSLSFHYTMSDGIDYRLRPPVFGNAADVPPKKFAGPEGDGTRRVAGWPMIYGSGHSHLNPLYLYGRYAFLPQIGLEFGLLIPTDPNEGWNRPGFRIGAPFKYVLSPGLLSVHARPDLLITFAKATDAWGTPDSTVLLTVYVDAGVTLTLLGVYLDVSVAYGADVYPYKKGHIPMTFLLGYTCTPQVDVYAGFTLANMTPEVGGAADARNLTAGVNVRF